jgi:hypothetical protein
LTPSVLALLLVLVQEATAQVAPGDEPSPPPTVSSEEAEVESEEEDPLSPYRARLDVLAERTIGTASKPVAFNWRRTHVHVAASGSFLFELNNFNSLRGGAMARLPAKKTLVELGLSYAHAWDTPSSTLLAFTPYRQAGRPDRIELDVTVAYPLAEGVVTTFPRFFPAVQLTFNAYGGLRYSVYPGGFPGMKPGQVAAALFSPALTQIEIDNLDDERLDAMAVDPGRYGLLLGFGNDIYFEQGIFLSPRMMLAVPLLAPASQTELLFWADFSLVLGMAF